MRLAGLAAPTSIAAAVLLAAVGGGRVAAGDPSTSTAREPAGALPRISVSTQRRIRDDPKVRATVRVEGSYDGPAGIELRGQSSESFPKKSYGLELRGPNGKDVRVGLLGMAPDGDWVLQGPWTDKTLMRNALAYDVARMTDRGAATPAEPASPLGALGGADAARRAAPERPLRGRVPPDRAP